MIKVNEGKIELKGNKLLIRAELTTLIHALFNSNILTKEEIEKDVAQGFMTDDELIKTKKELENRLDNKIDELLKALFE